MPKTEKKIIIIDPNYSYEAGFTDYLKSLNFSMETSTGLKDAVKKISEGCFDCLIIDVEIPKLRGYEVVSIIKSIDPEIKVIMTAQKNSKSLETKIREQDIFYYFIKSFEKEELRLAITSALNLKEKVKKEP